MVVHEGREVLVSLDGEMDKMTTEHDQPHLHMPSIVYFGGMDTQANTLGMQRLCTLNNAFTLRTTP